MQINIVLLLIFAILITLFAIFNAATVTISLIFFEIPVSLALVIIVSILIGAISIILFDSIKKIKAGKQNKELQKKIAELEKQILLKEEALSQRDSVIAQKDDIIKKQKSTIDECSENKSNNVVVQ